MDVSEMLSTLVSHGFDDASVPVTEKMLAINDTVWDIESREPWPFLTKSANLNFDGTNPYPSNIPSDFKAVVWIQDLKNGVPIWPIRIEDVRQNFTSTTVAVTDPTNFYFVGEQLRFFPTPPNDSSGRYLLDYLAIQPELASNSVEAAILMPARFHRIIVMGAISQLAAMEDDADIAAEFAGKMEARLQTMRFDLAMKQYMQPDRVLVTDQDDTYENYPY